MLASVIFVFLASAGLIESSLLLTPRSERFSRAVLARQDQASCLQKDLIQKSSDRTGQESGTDGIKPGQAESATDPDNFINFCNGQTITDGAQVTAGSCNGIPMGKIPSTKNMISAMITNPQPGKTIDADTTFNVSVQINHLNAGKFVNPTTNYYTAPQDLDGSGDIIGHCHVTVQSIGSLQSTTPPDPTAFAFFKGIDDAGNGQGLLQATVTGGLPAGVYRVCTMIAASNHQPVAMPVAQRGAQDDCTKFEVGGNSGGGGSGSSGNGNQGNQNQGGQNQGNQNQGNQNQGNQNQGNQNQGNQNQGGQNQGNQNQGNQNQGNQNQGNQNQGNQNQGGQNQGDQGQNNQEQKQGNGGRNQEVQGKGSQGNQTQAEVTQGQGSQPRCI